MASKVIRENVSSASAQATALFAAAALRLTELNKIAGNMSRTY